jgi:hypothetical protein
MTALAWPRTSKGDTDRNVAPGAGTGTLVVEYSLCENWIRTSAAGYFLLHQRGRSQLRDHTASKT